VGPAQPAGLDGRRDEGKPNRVAAFALGGALLAVVAVVAVMVLGLGHGSSQTGASAGNGQSSQPGGGGSALEPVAPSQPHVTVARISAAQVKFSWTYEDPVSGDTFQWTRMSGTAGKPSGVAIKPELIVTLPSGQSACFEVQVVRDGEASGPSSACWSQ
jgi:hypothetical protein